MPHLLIRYSEIALKGKNRAWFEKVLMKNLHVKLSSLNLHPKIQRISGRILITFSQNLNSQQRQQITQILQHIFGIANFSWTVSTDLNLNSFSQVCWQLLKKEKFSTFRITTQRSNKKFPLTSEKINQEVGAFIFEKLLRAGRKPQVQLKNPQRECYLEVSDQKAFLFIKKIKGLGGLPVGTSGQALVLLSGGIDSPIAAFYALKRGIKTDYIHFHALPYTNTKSIDKVTQLAETLNKFQGRSRIFLVPLAQIQETIVKNVLAKYRLLFYRRFMVYLANEIAKKHNYLALYTGESVGQVASQTLENIQISNSVSSLPILRPLIGLDKNEIVAKAQEIGTYPISILPHEDTCTRFIPTHPATKARLHIIEDLEKKLNKEKLIQKALDETEVKDISPEII